MRIDGFCFDVELLYLAELSGLKVAEVGVIWEDSPQSKVDVFKSSLNMFKELFRIKSIHK